MSGSVEYQLGEISARLRAIENRLDDGAKRHAGLDEADDELRERVGKLELVEAKRAGVIAAVVAFASLIGTVLGMYLNHLMKKFGA